MDLINIASMGYFDNQNQLSVVPPYMKAELPGAEGGPIILQQFSPGLGAATTAPPSTVNTPVVNQQDVSPGLGATTGILPNPVTPRQKKRKRKR